MKTQFVINVEAKDIDKELKEYISTKLRHIAQSEVDKLIDENLDGNLKKRIDNIVEKYNYFDSYALKEKIREESSQMITTLKIRDCIRECIKERIEQMDLSPLIEGILRSEIRSNTYAAIREKVFQTLDACVKESGEK